MEWQPIETAPKDGSQILIAAMDNFLTVGYWNEREYIWSIPSDVETQKAGVRHFRKAFNSDGDILEIYFPTHWMPLPEPPKN